MTCLSAPAIAALRAMLAADVAKALGISDDTAAVALCRLVSRRRLAKAPLGYSSRARE